MYSTTFPPFSVDTARAARAVFGIGNFYLTIGDQANQLFAGIALEDPSKRLSHTPRTLAMLYLISIFQYVETLPDSLVESALRERLDWKYALHLPLSYAHLEPIAMCEFRQQVLAEPAGTQTLRMLLARLDEIIHSDCNKFEGIPIDDFISRVCGISRLEKIWDKFNGALEVLATIRPDWLREISLPHWYERYRLQHRNPNLRIDHKQQRARAQAIGRDGAYLLKAIADSDLPELKELPAIAALRDVWQEQYLQMEASVLWRNKACAGCNSISRILALDEQE